MDAKFTWSIQGLTRLRWVSNSVKCKFSWGGCWKFLKIRKSRFGFCFLGKYSSYLCIFHVEKVMKITWEITLLRTYFLFGKLHPFICSPHDMLEEKDTYIKILEFTWVWSFKPEWLGLYFAIDIPFFFFFWQTNTSYNHHGGRLGAPCRPNCSMLMRRTLLLGKIDKRKREMKRFWVSKLQKECIVCFSFSNHGSKFYV